MKLLKAIYLFYTFQLIRLILSSIILGINVNSYKMFFYFLMFGSIEYFIKYLPFYFIIILIVILIERFINLSILYKLTLSLSIFICLLLVVSINYLDDFKCLINQSMLNKDKLSCMFRNGFSFIGTLLSYLLFIIYYTINSN